MKEELTRILILGIQWGLLLELLTVLLRFVFKQEMRVKASRWRRYTAGVRIHHAFPGLMGLGLVPLLPAGDPRVWIASFCVGLVISDALHHFAVLWPLTGDHEFHLRSDGEKPCSLRGELAAFSRGGAVLYGLFWGLMIESVTLLTRFGIESPAAGESSWLADLLLGPAFQHGYLGVAVLMPSLPRARTCWRSRLGIVVGTALLFSDGLHHLLAV